MVFRIVACQHSSNVLQLQVKEMLRYLEQLYFNTVMSVAQL